MNSLTKRILIIEEDIIVLKDAIIAPIAEIWRTHVILVVVTRLHVIILSIILSILLTFICTIGSILILASSRLRLSLRTSRISYKIWIRLAIEI